MLILGDGIAADNVRGVLLVMWRDSGSDLGRCDWLRTTILKAVRESGAGLLVLQVPLPSSTPPDGKARAHIQETFELAGGRLGAVVHLLVGDALRISLGRAFLRALHAVNRRSQPHVVCATLDEALRALEKHAGAPVDRAAIRSSIDALRHALGVETAV
jgi:hypothetical protein